MSLEDRIRSSVDTALEDLRRRVEADMHSLVDQLVTAAAQERDEAVRVARRAAFDEAWQTAEHEAMEATARALAMSEQQIADARAEERGKAERRIEEIASAGEAGIRELQHRADAQARLLESVQSLDRAATLTEVLDVLATAVSRETSRAALFVVRQDRLVGWRLSGFGPPDAQPKRVEVGLKERGLLADAVHEARPVSKRAESTAAVAALGELPAGAEALAVPVIVGGRVVAVVYGDATDSGSMSSGWGERVEILTRHGARCLEALTVQRAPVAAPPRFWVPTPAPGIEPATASVDSDAPAPVAVHAGTPA